MLHHVLPAAAFALCALGAVPALATIYERITLRSGRLASIDSWVVRHES